MQNASSNDSSLQNSGDAGGFLAEYEMYIRTQARKHVYSKRRMIHPDTLGMEIDDLVQRVMIKIWRAWQKTQIDNPQAYIRQVVHNESVSMIRQHTPTGPLPLNEDGEPWMHSDAMRQAWSMPDPADEYIEREETMALIHTVVKGLSVLSYCQQQAMLCSLYSRVDDPQKWIIACSTYNMDFLAVQWPVEKEKLQSMRSSVSIARKKLRATIYAPS